MTSPCDFLHYFLYVFLFQFDSWWTALPTTPIVVSLAQQLAPGCSDAPTDAVTFLYHCTEGAGQERTLQTVDLMSCEFPTARALQSAQVDSCCVCPASSRCTIILREESILLFFLLLFFLFFLKVLNHQCAHCAQGWGGESKSEGPSLTEREILQLSHMAL